MRYLLVLLLCLSLCCPAALAEASSFVQIVSGACDMLRTGVNALNTAYLQLNGLQAEASPASAPSETLSALFAQEGASLVPVSLLPDAKDVTLVAPVDGYDSVESLLESADVLGVSPQGNAMLLSVGANLLALHNGELRPIAPSQTRGVADTFSNLDKYLHYGSHNISTEGVAFSPDGRYAVMTNYNRLLNMMQFFYDPILLDLQTGEAILLETTNSRITRAERISKMTGACFSADNRFVYFSLLIRTRTDMRYSFSLVRYDLATLERETLATVVDPEISGTPVIAMAQNDCVVLPYISVRMHEKGVALLSPALIGYGMQTLPLVGTFNGYALNLTQFSAQSGLSLSLLTGTATVIPTPNSVLIRCRPTQGFEGANQPLGYDLSAGALVPVDLSEELPPERLFAFSSLDHAVLSPDGHFALLVTRTHSGDETKTSFALANLDTLEVRRLSADESVSSLNIYRDAAFFSFIDEDTLLFCDGQSSAALRIQ